MTATWTHEPVLVDEVLEHLAFAPGQVVVDGTVGAAGHLSLILDQIGPEGRAIAFDRDPAALALVRERLGDRLDQVTLVHDTFARLEVHLAELAPDGVDRILLDLGLSRDQMVSERFTFRGDAYLDMRLDPTAGETAADLLARLSAAELEQILTDYGDEPFARRIAESIVRDREREPVETAERLVELVRRSYPAKARHRRQHVATRTLQALRIAVNDLLGDLDRVLAVAPGLLRPGGRLGIIEFHSGEGRRVKQAFAEWVRRGGYRLVTRKPVGPTADEIARNRSARSARLRVLAAESEEQQR